MVVSVLGVDSLIDEDDSESVGNGFFGCGCMLMEWKGETAHFICSIAMGR